MKYEVFSIHTIHTIHRLKFGPLAFKFTCMSFSLYEQEFSRYNFENRKCAERSATKEAATKDLTVGQKYAVYAKQLLMSSQFDIPQFFSQLW